MAELLQLFQAGLAVTAVAIATVTLPASVVTDVEVPDLKPLMEALDYEP